MTSAAMVDPVAETEAVPALSVRGLRVRLGDREILHGIDLDAAPGEVIGIVGPPGAGKTTLLRAIAGADRHRGEVLIHGRLLAAKSPRAALDAGIAMIHQELALAPNLSAVENIVLGAEPRRPLLGLVPIIDRQASKAEARQLLSSIGIELSAEQLGRSVRTLSGGQRQAIAIARALRLGPAVLLMDEPTAALSPSGRQNLRGIVERLAERGVAVVVVSHDIDALLELARRFVVLRRGVKQADGAPETLDLDRLRDEAGEGPGVFDRIEREPWYRFDPVRWVMRR